MPVPAAPGQERRTARWRDSEARVVGKRELGEAVTEPEYIIPTPVGCTAVRSHGPLGQSIDAFEAFCIRLGWDAHVKAAQRNMLAPGWSAEEWREIRFREVYGLGFELPRKWWLY